jgi:hypothetical protein
MTSNTTGGESFTFFFCPTLVETFDLMAISIPFSFLFTLKKKKNEAGGWAV